MTENEHDSEGDGSSRRDSYVSFCCRPRNHSSILEGMQSNAATLQDTVASRSARQHGEKQLNLGPHP